MSSPGEAGGPALETVERFGRLMRFFPVAVSAGAAAGQWARQEDAPAGSTVVVDHEISSLGRLGQAWEVPQASSLVLATVLRPPVPPEEADVGWLVAGLGALNGAEAVTGRELALWWPDRVIEGDVGSVVASIKAESQLGPGEVRASVVTVRLDLGRLGLGADRREELLEAVVGALDQAAGELDDASQGVAAAYEQRCALLGQRVKLRILPKGETRGTARGVDRGGGLELASATGMIERISVDMLRDLVLA